MQLHGTEGGLNMTEDVVDRMVNKGVSEADLIKIQTAEALEDAARKLRKTDMSIHGEEVKHILHDVEARMDRLKVDAGVKFHSMESDGCKHMKPFEMSITDHPIPMLLMAVGAGFLIGSLISKSHN